MRVQQMQRRLARIDADRDRRGEQRDCEQRKSGDNENALQHGAAHSIP